MKKHLFISAAIILAAVLPSCTQNPEEVLDTATITFSVDEFVRDGAKTKTNVDPANNYAITWAETDIIGIFPRDGFQEPFKIPANQVGNATATFDGGYWQIKDGLTYNAYYPFSKDNFSDWDALEHIGVSYIGQSQNGKNCNAGAYDYTYSDWKTANLGKVSFAFHHLGSFVVLNLKLPATGTYTSLTLNSSEKNIPLKGTYDLTAASPVFVPDPSSLSNSISMELTNYSGTEGEDAVFYIMMPPVDLSGSTLTVVLSTSEGAASYSIESKNILASRLYEFTGSIVQESLNTLYGHEYVDLGLSVKWATMNVGASSITDYGDYFAWGDPQPYYSSQNPVVWKDSKSGGYTLNNYKYYSTRKETVDGFDVEINGYTKYVPQSKADEYGVNGFYDNKAVLDPEDDAAHVNWGGSWRIPTDAEWTELRNNCTWTWGSVNGIAGYRVTSKKYGFTDKWIFLPAAGFWRIDDLINDGSYGQFWSSSLHTIIPYCAFRMTLDSNSVYRDGDDRFYGRSIRPVSE